MKDKYGPAHPKTSVAVYYDNGTVAAHFESKEVSGYEVRNGVLMVSLTNGREMIYSSAWKWRILQKDNDE